MISCCSGIKPYEPRNHREEGLEKGLFSGPEGEFTIYQKMDESTTPDDITENSDTSGIVADPPEPECNSDTDEQGIQNAADAP